MVYVISSLYLLAAGFASLGFTNRKTDGMFRSRLLNVPFVRKVLMASLYLFVPITVTLFIYNWRLGLALLLIAFVISKIVLERLAHYVLMGIAWTVGVR